MQGKRKELIRNFGLLHKPEHMQRLDVLKNQKQAVLGQIDKISAAMRAVGRNPNTDSDIRNLQAQVSLLEKEIIQAENQLVASLVEESGHQLLTDVLDRSLLRTLQSAELEIHKTYQRYDELLKAPGIGIRPPPRPAQTLGLYAALPNGDILPGARMGKENAVLPVSTPIDSTGPNDHNANSVLYNGDMYVASPIHISPGDWIGHKTIAFQFQAVKPGSTCSFVLKNGTRFSFAWVPKGSGPIGSPMDEPGRNEDEPIQSELPMPSGFWMGCAEVTQGQWISIMGKNPSFFQSSTPNGPVENVSWDEVQLFLKELNGQISGRVRLPDEQEWEHACRGQSTSPFHYGQTITSAQVNFDGTHPCEGSEPSAFRQTTLSTNQFTPNAWGLFHMHGNVAEWCDTPYSATAADQRYVIRGGSWNSFADECRSAYRGRLSSRLKSPEVGFRLVFEDR